MKKFKVIFFLLICITWAFDCHGRLETVKHNESRSSSIFEQKCSNCHEANKSRLLLKDEKAWEETLFRMSKKQGAHITRSDVEKLQAVRVAFTVFCQQVDYYEGSVVVAALRRLPNCFGRDKPATTGICR